MKNSGQYIRLLITSGDGPRECQRAVSLCVMAMQEEANALNLTFEVTLDMDASDKDPPSALVTVSGEQCSAFAKEWLGTIKWTCPSPFRPNHKRQNWFIGVFALTMGQSEIPEIADIDIKFEAFRAGGPGGQHQNTTNSAVRATHIPTGLSVISRDERSQHRNKQTARNRLFDRMIFKKMNEKTQAKKSEYQLHRQLERGRPVRGFFGPRFLAD